MRDIMICQKCDFFMENQINPVTKVKLKLDSSFWKKYSFRRHSCEYEWLSTKFVMNILTEYYNLETPLECPYRLEHEMYGMNGEHGVVDYSMKRHFRRTRTCQHCGSTIPNRRKCPNCGYEYFKTYKPYSEVVAVVQFSLFIALAVIFLVACFST